jgi:hypothetical protein
MCPFDVLLKKLNTNFFPIFKLCFLEIDTEFFLYTVHIIHTRLKAPAPASGFLGCIYLFTTATPTLSAHVVTPNKHKSLHRIAEKIAF